MPSPAATERTRLSNQLVRRKSITSMIEDTQDASTGGLRRTFGVFQLTMISVGATLGTGILVILGEAVPIAGPAVWLAFILAGITALLSAVSYAEMAGMVPVSGSSYSYSYATLGEGVAWVCGWCLVLEYAVSVAAVAVGAADYVNETLRIFGLELPASLSAGPGIAESPGGVINLSALIVVLLATVLLMRGAKESGIVNTIIVFVKLGILVFFAIVAFTAFKAGNFEPLLPMGAAGVTAAASSVFFSYIGFDAASTAGEEAKNPKRDLPRAIILSMVIVTTMYVLVAVAAIGARQWQWFETAKAPLVQIVHELTQSNLAVFIFAASAVLAILSVVITVLYGQSRILLTMSRDGMVPRVFGIVSPRTGTPLVGTLVTGVLVAITAALIPLGELANATSIGTLFAFCLVNIAVIYLRVKRPDLPRSFKVPFGPVIPILGSLACAFLMVNLGGTTWIVFGLWMVVGASSTSTYAPPTPASAPSATATTAPAWTPEPRSRSAQPPRRHKTSPAPGTFSDVGKPSSGWSLSAAAGAGDFVEGDGRSDSRVEGLRGRSDRDRDDLVALVGDETRDALALGADDDAQRVAAEGQLRQLDLTVHVESDDEDVLFLELVDGARQVDDLGDLDAGGRTGGGLPRGGGHRSGTTFGDDDPVPAEGSRRAHDGAEVPRVRDAVEGNSSGASARSAATSSRSRGSA